VPVLVACTGAKTGEFFKSQGKSPAEWTPSMGRYDLVTFSFGGDDIGFASIVQSEVVSFFVEFEVAVPRLTPASGRCSGDRQVTRTARGPPP
jgi:hypothetical protein